MSRLAYGAALMVGGLSLTQLALPRLPRIMSVLSLLLAGMFLLIAVLLPRTRPSSALLDRTWALMMLMLGVLMLLRVWLDPDPLRAYLILPLLPLGGAFIRSRRVILVLVPCLLGLVVAAWCHAQPGCYRPELMVPNALVFALAGLFVHRIFSLLVRHTQGRIRRLARARHQIQRLEDLVPICAQCKRVRNDEGYWQQVEAFMAERRVASFSHGLCPACLAKARAEFLGRGKGGSGKQGQ